MVKRRNIGRRSPTGFRTRLITRDRPVSRKLPFEALFSRPVDRLTKVGGGVGTASGMEKNSRRAHSPAAGLSVL